MPHQTIWFGLMWVRVGSQIYSHNKVVKARYFHSGVQSHWVTCPQAIIESFIYSLGGVCLHPIITSLIVTARYKNKEEYYWLFCNHNTTSRACSWSNAEVSRMPNHNANQQVPAKHECIICLLDLQSVGSSTMWKNKYGTMTLTCGFAMWGIREGSFGHAANIQGTCIHRRHMNEIYIYTYISADWFCTSISWVCPHRQIISLPWSLILYGKWEY